MDCEHPVEIVKNPYIVRVFYYFILYIPYWSSVSHALVFGPQPPVCSKPRDF